MASNWHPLTMLSYTADYSIWGQDPLGYHLVNNLLHSANTLLVGVLGARLTEQAGSGARASLFTGATLALLFGLHPLHVESVAWVSERKDVLSTLFFLLSIISYLRYKKASKPLPYIGSLFLFALSVMGKPMSITLPAVLLILDFYPPQVLRQALKRRSSRRSLTSPCR